MSTRQKAVLVNTTGFIMILSALFFMTLPVLSISMIDFGKPSVAKWDSGKNGGDKELVIKYDDFDNFNEVVYGFQKLLHLPSRFTMKGSVVFGVSMIFIFIFFIGAFIDVGHDEDKLFRLILPATLLVVVALIAAPFIGSHVYGISDKIRSSVEGKDLAEAVVNKYWKDAVILRIFFSAVCMILVGLLSLLLASRTRFHFWEKYIVGKLYAGWKEKVFADILKNRRVSLLNEFVEENRDSIVQGYINENQENVSTATENSTRILNTKNEVLQFLPNGAIELVRYNYHLEWTPLPIFVLTKEVSNSISINNFFRYLMADSKDVAFTELREKLMESYGNRFGQVGEDSIAVFVNGLIAEVRKRFGETMSSARKNELSASSEYTEKMIQFVVNKALRKFKSEVAKIGTDEMDFILSNFRERLIKEVHSRMTMLFNNQDRSSAKEAGILPQGTRFHIQKNDYDFLVVEQSPQTRTVSVSNSLSKRDDKNSFNLAFPYVVFLLVFKEERLTGFFVHYRNRPLTSLDDRLCRPNLPNMDGTNVCLGFNGHNVIGLVARTEEVIGHFWNSQFNRDWRDNYELYSYRDRRLKNFSVWERNSKENPLFVLDVQWEEMFSLRDMIVRHASNIEEFSSRFGEEEIKSAFAVTGDDMREALMKRFGKIKVKNKYSDLISTTVKEHREEVINRSFDGVESSFRHAVDCDSLDKSFQGKMNEAINGTLEHDFSQLAGEVLIRRRIEPNELIDKIREGR